MTAQSDSVEAAIMQRAAVNETFAIAYALLQLSAALEKLADEVGSGLATLDVMLKSE